LICICSLSVKELHSFVKPIAIDHLVVLDGLGWEPHLGSMVIAGFPFFDGCRPFGHSSCFSSVLPLSTFTDNPTDAITFF